VVAGVRNVTLRERLKVEDGQRFTAILRQTNEMGL
jgi:hypothetical protein